MFDKIFLFLIKEPLDKRRIKKKYQKFIRQNVCKPDAENAVNPINL